MFYRLTAGTTLMLSLAMAGHGLAAGAVAVGEPADISQDGVAIYTFVNAPNAETAKARALEGCKGLQNASQTSRSLCKVVASFENQCVAEALDPQDGTPGFGWAMAGNSQEAKRQALSNCRDTAGPTRQDACIVDTKGLWCDGRAK
jgi:predicted dinucleotide-binding enzyme